MTNPFEQIDTKLTNIQNLLESLVKLPNEQGEQPEKDELLTIQQTADFLSLAVPTIYTMVSRGEIPVMKRSKRLYFSRIELINYLKQGRKKTIAETASEAENYINKKGLNNGK